jgi:adenylate cyclase
VSFEIERKFLVRTAEWQGLSSKQTTIRQAYLAAEETISIRLRIKGGDCATLTIKSGDAALRRLEFEYAIAPADADALMALRRGAIIDKTRHTIPWQGLTWEIDVFAGDNAGLVIAEIELQEENQRFALPTWLGEEVTGQAQYYNRRLALYPYCDWGRRQQAERVEGAEISDKSGQRSGARRDCDPT